VCLLRPKDVWSKALRRFLGKTRSHPRVGFLLIVCTSHCSSLCLVRGRLASACFLVRGRLASACFLVRGRGDDPSHPVHHMGCTRKSSFLEKGRPMDGRNRGPSIQPNVSRRCYQRRAPNQATAPVKLPMYHGPLGVQGETSMTQRVVFHRGTPESVLPPMLSTVPTVSMIHYSKGA
jgi:hypothetical protein